MVPSVLPSLWRACTPVTTAERPAKSPSADPGGKRPACRAQAGRRWRARGWPGGASGPRAFGFGGAIGSATRPAAGTKINIDTLANFGLGTLRASSVADIARLHRAGRLAMPAS